MEGFEFALNAFTAGILASIACGFGTLPLLVKQFRIEERIGLGYGFAGGLMFAASVYARRRSGNGDRRPVLADHLDSDRAAVEVCLDLVDRTCADARTASSVEATQAI